jgi:hypothetical protein
LPKMSQEALRQEQERLDRLWEAVVKKHHVALEQLGLTARLNYVDSAYVEVAAKEAWNQVRAKCPERAKAADLRRRIPELK